MTLTLKTDWKSSDGVGAADFNRIESNIGSLIPNTVSATLSASRWSGASAPYTQTVSVPYVKGDSHIIVSIRSSANQAQFQAGVDAQLHATAQAAESVTITAFDTKPSIDIPIDILVLL